MGEGLLPPPDRNPELLLETLTGPLLDNHLLGLVARNMDTLSVDGYRLVCMNSRSVNPDTHVVTVECRDDEHHQHRLMYTLDDDSPVAHEMLKDRPDPRTEIV